MPRRPDGELVNTSKYHELEFYIMRTKTESIIYYNTLVDLSNTYKFLEEYNKEKEEKDKLTLFQIYLTAAGRTITLRPKINRFISGRRLWQRNQIKFAFVVNKEKSENSDEVNAMVEFDPFDTLETIQKRLYKILYQARNEENPNEKDIKFYGSLPRWLIRLIFWVVRWTDEHNIPIYSITKDVPMWCSMYLAHLGSIGIDAVYHHLFEMGTAGILTTIGTIHKAPVVDQETGKIEVKEVMELKVSIDDRIASGIYTGPTMDLFKELIENPESLLKPPELSDEQLDKLMLEKYKKERLEREKKKRKAKKS